MTMSSGDPGQNGAFCPSEPGSNCTLCSKNVAADRKMKPKPTATATRNATPAPQKECQSAVVISRNVTLDASSAGHRLDTPKSDWTRTAFVPTGADARGARYGSPGRYSSAPRSYGTIVTPGRDCGVLDQIRVHQNADASSGSARPSATRATFRIKSKGLATRSAPSMSDVTPASPPMVANRAV